MTTAIRYTQYGDPDVLSLDEVPTPEPGPGQVRVAVRAAGVNPADWKIRRGLWSGGTPLAHAAGVGLELAGTIDAVGPGVTEFTEGQAVFGKVPSGAAATHALAAVDDLLLKPDWLTFEQAASLPVVAGTAARVLRLLGVESGQTLLIHAVAGGVGLTVAQLALARGAVVIGTASAARHAFLRERGIEPVLYGDGLAERVRALAPGGVDLVLDASGRGELPVSIELAGEPKNVLTIVDPDMASKYGARYSGGGNAEPVQLAEVFGELLPLVERGDFQMPIAASFPLERTADAHRLSEDGHLLGWIVITVS